MNVTARFCLILTFLLALAACSTRGESAADFLDDISGVWRADGDATMISIIYAQDKEALRGAQNDWRLSERDACSNVPCMQRAYDNRLSELRDY